MARRILNNRCARRKRKAQIVHDAFGRNSGEAHSEHHQIRIDDFGRIRNFVRLERATLRGHFPFHANRFHASNATIFHDELLGRNVPTAFTAFVLCIACTQHVRPIRPRRRRRTFLRRLRHEFHLQNAFATFTNRLTHAVITRITTANHKYLAALGRELFRILFTRHFSAMQKVERKENAFSITTRNFQVTSIRRTDGKENFIKILVDVFRSDVLPYFGIVNKLDSSCFKQSHATVNHRLVEFPVRNAITQEATGLFTLFVNGNSIAFTAKRFGGKQTRRA